MNTWQKTISIFIFFLFSWTVSAAIPASSYTGDLNATFDIGSLDSGAFSWSGSVLGNGNFSHSYTFTVPTDSGLGGGAVPLNFSLFGGAITSNISSFSLSLTDGLNTYNASQFAYGLNLFAGTDYTLQASGLAAGTNDVYAVSIVSAVPEVEQWLMMIVGLVLVLMQVSKQRNSTNPIFTPMAA